MYDKDIFSHSIALSWRFLLVFLLVETLYGYIVPDAVYELDESGFLLFMLVVTCLKIFCSTYGALLWLTITARNKHSG
ncbi:hypothetical protein [Candidatus Synchoanobacter obligatus]|uniref:Uncharacterized protein n=1 Tax=Candidatus Synchoanobacter obligatus TaxID=2919597 RepID=A0ABT1L5W2_9GAMM|nr:hypothetical protein [Candidatus Synchoanobacter obligatus]MCP8352574.1 hypothetical protein [Candidatus Synchoanobacter obligatus]